MAVQHTVNPRGQPDFTMDPSPLLRYDPEADALYITLSRQRTEATLEIKPSVYLDLDADGQPVGIEVLSPSIPDLPRVTTLRALLLS